MKKKLFVGFALVAIIAMLAACSGATSHVLSGSGSRSFSPSTWKLKGSWNGHISRSYNLTADNADTIYVSSSNSGGEMILVLTQNGNERKVDISGEYNGNIDLNDFEPGIVKVRLNLDSTKGVDLNISWR